MSIRLKGKAGIPMRIVAKVFSPDKNNTDAVMIYNQAGKMIGFMDR